MSRVYIGRLPARCCERDIERFFRGYGRLRDIVLKTGYGFVEFDDERDADDAVYDLHGRELRGERIVVEHARLPPGARGSSRRRESRYGPPTRTDYRVIVENLSSRVSWQDLKDMMRKAGEVTYADAHKQVRNEGIVEFATYNDMKAAIDKYDGYVLYERRLKVYADKPRHRSRSGSRRSRSRRSSRRSKSRGSRRRDRSRSDSRRRSSSRHSRSDRDRSRRSDHTRSDESRKSGSRSRSRSRRSDRSASRRSDRRSAGRRSCSASRNGDGSIAGKARSRSASRDRSRSGSRERSRSPSRSGSERRSRSGSPAGRSRSASKSRSRSRSMSETEETRQEAVEHHGEDKKQESMEN
ncbi:Splicing factor arginine:serine rich 4 [Echinococcus multilocularis]|uniref:Splicing factor arginine:serine rich 4 n=1 Tax=Echinococcus multilocularis TaxID=6211 RepID=A0A087W0U9_ECHMU|nr:Splicing factor arginine:serine rich 4 [Echinococcus multilocularis]